MSTTAIYENYYFQEVILRAMAGSGQRATDGGSGGRRTAGAATVRPGLSVKMRRERR